MKKFILMFAALFTFATTFVLTSCTDDEDPTSEFYYSAIVSNFESSELQELGQIQHIYYNALGISDATFTLKGSEKDCNNKIRTACQSAQKEIEAKEWNSTFTFTVTELNNEKIIYQFNYPK